MKPTQAQIEAARLAIAKIQKCALPCACYRNPQPMDCMTMATAALTAAAEVEKDQTALDYAIGANFSLAAENEELRAKIAALTTAVEVGGLSEYKRGFEDCQKGRTDEYAAAEAGEKAYTDLTRQQLVDEIIKLHDEVDATIERCVQVVRRYAVNIGEMAETIAVEIEAIDETACPLCGQVGPHPNCTGCNTTGRRGVEAATIERCAQVAKAAKETAIKEYQQRKKENDASADYYLWCRDEADEIEAAIRALKDT